MLDVFLENQFRLVLVQQLATKIIVERNIFWSNRFLEIFLASAKFYSNKTLLDVLGKEIEVSIDQASYFIPHGFGFSSLDFCFPTSYIVPKFMAVQLILFICIIAPDPKDQFLRNIIFVVHYQSIIVLFIRQFLFCISVRHAITINGQTIF